MMDKQCDAAVQQKLADYAQQGGRLVLVGRMCTETFEHAPCTILPDALGIDRIDSDPPFTPASIRAFEHRDIPVSFLETYSAISTTCSLRQWMGRPSASSNGSARVG